MNGASPLRQVVGGASIGNAVAWYDFAIYAAFYVIVAAVISLITLLTVRESAKRPLPEFTTSEVAAL